MTAQTMKGSGWAIGLVAAEGAGGWGNAGDGDAENYSATLIKGDGASALVLLDGASQNWTCSFTGIGSLDAKGGLVVARPAEPAKSLRILRTGDGLAIAGEDDHADFRMRLTTR